MSNKPILLFGSDPGSVNAMVGVCKLIQEKNQAYQFYVDNDWAMNTYPDLNPIKIKHSKLDELINDSVGLVICGTSTNSEFEKKVFEITSKQEVRTIGFIDHFTNYVERFELNNNVVLPDQIWVLNQDCIDQAIQAGLPKEKLVVCPNPFWNLVAEEGSSKKANALLKDGEELKILFLSDALTEAKGSRELAREEFGFDEFETLSTLINAIKNFPQIRIGVRLHPLEVKNKFVDLLEEHPNVSLLNNEPLKKQVSEHHLTVGMFTMALIEAVLLGARVLRLEPFHGEKVDRLPIFDIERCYSERDLIEKLKNIDGIKNLCSENEIQSWKQTQLNVLKEVLWTGEIEEKSISMKSISQELYSPTWLTGESINLEPEGSGVVLYFHLARYALFELLKVAKAKKVLLPQFICRDVVDVLTAQDIEPIYYHVDKKFNVEMDSLPESTDADFFLWVNYFGLDSSFEPIKQYCERQKIEIIEDNAQSFQCFLDMQGKSRETFGDYRLHSFRKSLPVGTGASLEVSPNARLISAFRDIQNNSKNKLELAVSKNKIRKLLNVLPLGVIRMLLKLKRSLSSGSESVPGNIETNYELFGESRIPAVDAVRMKEKRRLAYKGLKTYLSKRYDGINFLGQFTDVSAPSALAIEIQPEDYEQVGRDLDALHLDLVRWPSFYDESIVDRESFYHRVYIVPLNW